MNVFKKFSIFSVVLLIQKFLRSIQTIPTRLMKRFSGDFGVQISYQGSLICQAILDFGGRTRKIFIDALMETEKETLEKIFDSSPGSFLLEKMAKTMPEKKFGEYLQKMPLNKIAFGKFGSRAVEGVWKNVGIRKR